VIEDKRVQVVMVMTMKTAFFCDVTQYSLVVMYSYSEGNCFFYRPYILMIGATAFFKILIPIYQDMMSHQRQQYSIYSNAR